MLPDMTGLEVCRKIKEDGTLKDTFVILVSGILVSSEFQADGFETGADGYIIKPIDNAEFRARVRSVVRIKRTERALRQKERSRGPHLQAAQRPRGNQDLEGVPAHLRLLQEDPRRSGLLESIGSIYLRPLRRDSHPRGLSPVRRRLPGPNKSSKEARENGQTAHGE